jgi:putative peptidoglycan lipid II flippase
LFTYTSIVTTNIASGLQTGALSAYNWGWRLMQIPQTLIGSAMATVIFPTLAALSEVGDQNGKRDSMNGSIRFILIASIPSAVALIVIGQPLVSLLERGAFDASASALIYSTLRFFALGIVVHSVLEIVTRSFYADKDTFTPLWVSLIGSVIYVFLATTLTDGGDVSGLALANTVAYAIEVVLLLWVLRRRWHGIGENALAATALKALAASLVMAVVIVLVNTAFVGFGLDTNNTSITIVQIAIEGVVGLTTFMIVAWLLRMDELRHLFALISRWRKVAEVTTA